MNKIDFWPADSMCTLSKPELAEADKWHQVKQQSKQDHTPVSNNRSTPSNNARHAHMQCRGSIVTCNSLINQYNVAEHGDRDVERGIPADEGPVGAIFTSTVESRTFSSDIGSPASGVLWGVFSSIAIL